MTSQMLQRCVPKVDLRKKKDYIANHMNSYRSEQIRFFESMSLKDFSKRVMSLKITAKYLELVGKGEFVDVSIPKRASSFFFRKQSIRRAAPRLRLNSRATRTSHQKRS